MTGRPSPTRCPASLTGVTWTCAWYRGSARVRRAAAAASTRRSTCRSGGIGDLHGDAARSAPRPRARWSNTATVAPPAGVTDPTPGNNTATDTDTLDADGGSVDHQDRRRNRRGAGYVGDLHDRRQQHRSVAPSPRHRDRHDVSVTQWRVVDMHAERRAPRARREAEAATSTPPSISPSAGRRHSRSRQPSWRPPPAASSTLQRSPHRLE